MKHINHKQYSQALKADKERILSELSLIKNNIIYSNEGTKILINDIGEDEVIKQFGHLPIDNELETYEAIRYNAIDVDSTGVITLNTINGSIKFPIDQLALIEKRVKRTFPSSSATNPIVPNFGTNPTHHTYVEYCDKEGYIKDKEQVLSEIDSRIKANEENVSQAKRMGSINLIQLYQKEIELLKQARSEAEDTDFEEKKIEKYILKDLSENPLILRIKETDGCCEYKMLHLGRMLIAFNLINYRLDSKKSIEDFYEALIQATAIKNHPEPISVKQWLDNKIAEHDSTEKELKEKYWSDRKGYWKARNTKAQENEFSRLQDRISGLEQNILTINDFYSLIDGALGNEPFDVRGNNTPKIEIITPEIEILSPIQESEPMPSMKKVLAIDIETYSPVDLNESGLYKYAAHPDFEILLFAFAFDSDPVTVIDLVNFEEIPDEVITALTDPNVLKTAHNANFERICISRHLGIALQIEQWECTMCKSAMLGLPFALGAVGKVLKLDQEKMAEGKSLIRYFSCPCKPTKTNGLRERNMPEHDPEKWSTYKSYNGRDVEAEREIREKTAFFKMHEGEKELYILDQKINDRGVMVDMQFVRNAIRMDAVYKERLTAEMTELTSLDNPNSVAQLKAWIADEIGEDVTSLTKEAILEMLKNTPSEEVTKVLKNRQEMAKTSVKKYQAMAAAVGADGRIRGLLQFYGANRTGRWCLAEGSLVKVKNAQGISEKAIEEVLTTDLVFDGDNWVKHEGVVFSGDKDVISWDGVTASLTHIVYTSDYEKMTLAEAKEKKLNLWAGNIQFTN